MTQPAVEDQPQQPLLQESESPPSPADLARRQQANAEQQPPELEQETPKPAPPKPQSRPPSPPQNSPSDNDDEDDEYEDEIPKHIRDIRRVRRENQNLRARLRQAEERATDYETQQEGYQRLEVAVQFGVEPDDIELIGSGSREDMERRATRIVSRYSEADVGRTSPPPSDRPVEGLRPGATPEPPQPVDNSYPANWGFQPPQRQT